MRYVLRQSEQAKKPKTVEMIRPPYANLIKVKVISPFSNRWFLHQLPKNMTWGECVFTLDASETKYDWLVSYNNIPKNPLTKSKCNCVDLTCPREQTILTTTEPASISHYGKAFTKQFGHVLTSQSESDLPHKNRIFQQAGLIWLYGIGYEGPAQSFEDMVENIPENKTEDLAMVFSGKKMRMSLHNKRYHFMKYMEEHLPNMHIYGRSPHHIPLDDKTLALANYKYSFALENHIEKHHWTEKLADAFLGLTLPFYAGCPNASDYFPEESFIPIDIRKPDEALEVILKASRDNEYEKRLPAIHEARRRVLFEHNLFAVLSREIEKRHNPDINPNPKNHICSRHAVRAQSAMYWMSDLFGRAKLKLKHFEL